MKEKWLDAAGLAYLAAEASAFALSWRELPERFSARGGATIDRMTFVGFLAGFDICILLWTSDFMSKKPEAQRKSLRLAGFAFIGLIEVNSIRQNESGSLELPVLAFAIISGVFLCVGMGSYLRLGRVKNEWPR